MRRRWTKKEIARLYLFSETTSQKVAAEKLGRTAVSVSAKARSLGIHWRQGLENYETLAIKAGCAPNTVRRVVWILWPEGPPGYRGKGVIRLALGPEDAERVLRILAANQKNPMRQKKKRAALARYSAKKSCQPQSSQEFF